MDMTTFDSVARLFGSSMTRREALRGLVAGATAVSAGGVLLRAEDAAAKRRRKKTRKRNRRHDRCGRHGDGCGALDADTGEPTAPYCCHGLACAYGPGDGSWTCQVVP